MLTRDDGDVQLYQGDAVTVLATLADASVQTCITSPPYWGLRDYGEPGQLGLESTPLQYVRNIVCVFREVRRVLRDDGTLWLNLGDSYAAGGAGPPSSTSTLMGNGHRGGGPKAARTQSIVRTAAGCKHKDLVGIPWRVAFALQDDGWYLRSDIIWHKPNAMPESVRDRPTKAHEYVFLLTKSERYYYDADAIREPDSGYASGNGFAGRQGGAEYHARSGGSGTTERHVPGAGRNARTVWRITTKPYAGAHFATFPPQLPERCIKASTQDGDIVLDPFCGSGTTMAVARMLGRRGIGIELNPSYLDLASERLQQLSLFGQVP
jgi:DNA modification methylase